MKNLLSRAFVRRSAVVAATAAVLVPFGTAANAYTEEVCNDDYTECWNVEYPEFEDLVTSISVNSVTLAKSSQSKVTVTVKFSDPGYEYEIDEDLSWLTLESEANLDARGMLDLEYVSPGVLQAVGYATADTAPGKWWVDSIHVWMDYPTADFAYSTYDDTYVASFYARRNTTLTLNASPEPVAKGKTITVSGTLKKLNPGSLASATDAYYAAYSGKTIKIYFDPKGTLPKKYMGSTTTNSKGNYSKKFTAKVDGTWTAEFAGTSNYVAKKSTGDFVDVR